MRKNTNIEYVKSFGENLRKIRIEKKMSMTALAIEVNIEYSQISRIELGKISTSLSVIKAIADALEINPKELFDF